MKNSIVYRVLLIAFYDKGTIKLQHMNVCICEGKATPLAEVGLIYHQMYVR